MQFYFTRYLPLLTPSDMRLPVPSSLQYLALGLLPALLALAPLPACGQKKPAAKKPAAAAVTVPPGFRCQVIAENLGPTRHLVVTPQGGIYLRLADVKDGAGTLYLRDDNKDGKWEVAKRFGTFSGTGIALDADYLYTASNTEIFRYKLDAKGELAAPGTPERIVTGLVDKGQHASKSITLDGKGHIYVGIGAPSNTCQVQDRTQGSPGMQPCGMLDSVGGVWQFAIDKKDQRLQDGVRFATGLRNVVGLDWNDQTNSLFVMQHGRDQLSYLYPKLFDDKKSAETPAECLFEIRQPGDDAGWPYVYYDLAEKKKMVSPEYGGDGKTATDKYLDPAQAFPAHMAPNAVQFYTAAQFPEAYRNGAFIAFHGSWNRSPEPQEGYYVVFQPFKDGKPDGPWTVFADGFAGPRPVLSPAKALHRPCGLALGPDGSLYICDDVKGSVYRITTAKL